jgi:uncharacterized protein (TIGR02284 family)
MSDHGPRAVLNHLIETCKDGEHGFRHAADLVTDQALKSLFADMADQRLRIAGELTPHAQRLGGAATSEGTTGAAVHRRWMDLRSTISGHDDGTVLAEARRGDAVTVTVFRSALAGVLPATVRDLVERKFNELRLAHEYLAELERTRLVGM